MGFIIVITLLAVFALFRSNSTYDPFYAMSYISWQRRAKKGHQDRNRGFTRMRRIDADYS